MILISTFRLVEAKAEQGAIDADGHVEVLLISLKKILVLFEGRILVYSYKILALV